MKKRLMSILLTLCMVLALLPATAFAASTQNASETFTDFALRMQSEYNVKVSCDPSVTVTLEEQGYIENALSLWGKDFIKIVSAGFRQPKLQRQLEIRITDDDGVYFNVNASGVAVENRIFLYPGWTYITVIHEIAHAVTFSWEAKALTDLYDREMTVKFFKEMEKAHTKSGGKSYVPPSCSAAGKAGAGNAVSVAFDNAYEDIASILQNGYDTDWIAKVKRGELPGEKAKIEVFRDFYNEYLTGGATPCLLVDSILGTNGVSISSQPAVTTTVTEGRIEGSLSIDVINSGGKKISYRWATSTANKFPPHGSLTQIKTASMGIPKSLKAGTYYYFCVIYVDGKEVLNSNIATIIVQPDTSAPGYIDPSTLSLGLNILSLPAKTTYIVGEGFDKTGIRAVFKSSNGTVEDQTDKIKFYTSRTVELTQGRLFQTSGTKEVELRHITYGKQREKFTITVSE